MFGIPITSWEKLVSDFAQELDMSNFESRPYVDLTGQDTGTHVNSMYAEGFARGLRADGAVCAVEAGGGVREALPCA